MRELCSKVTEESPVCSETLINQLVGGKLTAIKV